MPETDIVTMSLSNNLGLLIVFFLKDAINVLILCVYLTKQVLGCYYSIFRNHVNSAAVSLLVFEIWLIFQFILVTSISQF